ncbi:MAG: hypothetical protein SF097_04635 [Acidobacteriota bacterium]|nr:hypothetical protein [Acidobacteriota bacterium]
MATTKTRLAALETRSATLPPDGASLLRACERLPENERAAWTRSLTDDELMAMMRQHVAKYGGLDIDRLEENELEELCLIDDDAKYEEWISQLRLTKPHYFNKGKQ